MPAGTGQKASLANHLKMKNVEIITPRLLTQVLEQQQRQAILKWVADPFGNSVKNFPVALPAGSQIEHEGGLKVLGEQPYSVCLKVHEVRVPKSRATRAARLPDGGVAKADGNWTWGAGNAPVEASE